MQDKEILDGLSKHERRLLRAAAEAAEHGYRRGVQHGALVMEKHVAQGGDSKTLAQDIAVWRLLRRRPYRAAVSLPGFIPYKTTVLDRFLMESSGRVFDDLLRGLK